MQGFTLIKWSDGCVKSNVQWVVPNQLIVPN